ncbi:unnamed protein product [Gongylonema pulchrum]|uniref:Reverse transcriptase n=1 Tax=Gongylonema pulchrum TaxID=637853 RepID=A0A183D425_9BILA|nr:unnamed protein product [Gongylonema pulchrum]
MDVRCLWGTAVVSGRSVPIALLLLNPVWQYQQVPQKIGGCIRSVYFATEDIARRFVFFPIYSVYRVFDYVLMLRWLPVLVGKLSSVLLRIRAAINSAYVSLLTTLRDARDAGLNSVLCAVLAIKTLIRRIVIGMRNAPIVDSYQATISFLRYWLGAQWWPSLKSWIILNIGRRLQRLFNYFCFGLVYIFCGYWVEPVSAFLSRNLQRFYGYFKRTVLIPLKMQVSPYILPFFQKIEKYYRSGIRISALYSQALIKKFCAALTRKVFVRLYSYLALNFK